MGQVRADARSVLSPSSPSVAAAAAPLDLTAELQKLPMQNATALRVLALLDDPDVLIADLGRLIAGDTALATKVLKLANSTFFGRRNEVTSLDKAIVAVGLSTVRTFTLAAAFDLFNDTGAPLPDDFWTHSVASAAGASVVAKHARLAPGDAFSAGLLHDLGVALLYRFDAERYALTCLSVPDSAARCDIERREFGHDHPEAAALALGAARFPKALVEAIADHHQPVRKKRMGKPELSSVVAVGERLGELGSLEEAQPDELAAVGELLGVIGVDVPLSRLLDEVASTRDDIAAFVRM